MTEKPYDVIVTRHARERWIERIADPQRYQHLKSCAGCQTCNSLLYDLRQAAELCARQISGRLADLYREAKAANRKVTDPTFLQIIKERSEPNKNYDFLVSNSPKAILMLSIQTEGPPVLVTILSGDMLEGTIFRHCNREDLQKVFGRWKFEARQR